MGAVDIRIKDGRSHDELTQLSLRRRAAPAGPAPDVVDVSAAPSVPWDDDACGAAALVEELDRRRPRLLRVTEIPNPRTEPELAAMRALDNGAQPDAARAALCEPRAAPRASSRRRSAPSANGSATAWRAPRRAAADGSYDAVFVARGAAAPGMLHGLHRSPAGDEPDDEPPRHHPAATRAMNSLVPALRAHAAEHLPAAHGAGPRSSCSNGSPSPPSGKLDVAALPPPVTVAPATGSARRRPSPERVLCDLFADVLGLPQAGVEDDFFALGGHSLLATRLALRIRSELCADLSLRDVFEAPTPAALALRADAAATAAPPPAPADPARARAAVVRAAAAVAPSPRSRARSPTTSRSSLAAARRAGHGRAARRARTTSSRATSSLRTVVGLHDGEPFQEIRPAEEARLEIDVVKAAPAPTGSTRSLDAVATPAVRPGPVSCRCASRSPRWPPASTSSSSRCTTSRPTSGLTARCSADLADGLRGAPLEGRPPGWDPAGAAVRRLHPLAARAARRARRSGQPHCTPSSSTGRATLEDLPDELALPADRRRPPAPTFRGGARDARSTLPAALHAALPALARDS